MRFRRIRIPAYGPFTDFELDLPNENGDFHIIYGPNEAGKSSLLRAIHGFLFGIETRTTDDFIHPKSNLRIECELENPAGDARTFRRRKGNKNTLRDTGDQPVPELELKDLLDGVDEDYFDGMFGLDAGKLRQGADALLRGEGRLGEALFSAAMGGTPVEKVIKVLEGRAGEIFAGRAQKSIRKTLAEYNEHVRAKKDAMVKPDSWEQIGRELDEAVARLDELKKEREKLEREKSWLERCSVALPMVGKLDDLHRRLSELTELPELPESFAGEIEEARKGWLDAVREVGGLEADLRRLEERAANCRYSEEILADEEELEEIHTRLGAWESDVENLAAKRSEAEQLAKRMKTKCRDLEIPVPLEELERFRVTEVQYSEAQQAESAFRNRAEAFRNASGKVRELEEKIRKLEDDRREVDEKKLESLETARTMAQAVEETAKGLTKRGRELEALRRDMERRLGALPGVPEGDVEEACALPVPMRTTIEKFREEEAALENERKALEKERRGLRREIRKLASEIDRLKTSRELPGLDDLKAARARRDHGWELVVAEWKGGGTDEVFDEALPLEKAYPKAVGKADEIADRLREEAEIVAQILEKDGLRKEREGELEEVDARMEEWKKSRADWESRWEAAWDGCGVAPASPSEMLEWRANWEELGRLLEAWREQEEVLRRDRRRVDERTRALAGTLGSGEFEFGVLLALAEEKIAELGRARTEELATRRRIREAREELEQCRDSLPKAEAALTEARARWEELCDQFEIPKDVPADLGLGLLASRREMFRDFDRRSEILGECKRLERKIREFEARILSVAGNHGVAEGKPSVMERELWKDLKASKKGRAQFEALRKEKEDIAERLEKARQSVSNARAEFDALLEKTGPVDESDLDVFLVRFRDRAKWRRASDEIRTGLAGAARAEDVEEFIGRVRVEDAAEIDVKLVELEERLEELKKEIADADAERRECLRRRGELENASDEAARHGQEAEFALARMREDAERFARLRIAIALLQGRIEEFRRQNQGPFMEKAGRWFAELTGGSFSGIAPDYGKDDQPVIAGVRDGGEALVKVEGMSEGTRDQLYFALRLAGLEFHLQDHQPMPMILDDLLVHFDDQRARFALAALSRMGRRSQVLLFTHHAHLLDLARDELGGDGFHAVEIGGGAVAD